MAPLQSLIELGDQLCEVWQVVVHWLWLTWPTTTKQQQAKQPQHNAAATESKNLCCYNHHLCTKISLSNLQERK